MIRLPHNAMSCLGWEARQVNIVLILTDKAVTASPLQLPPSLFKNGRQYQIPHIPKISKWLTKIGQS